jgi:hypothetical protein
LMLTQSAPRVKVATVSQYSVKIAGRWTGEKP